MIDRNSRGHELYAIVEEENDQVIGVVDCVVDTVLKKLFVYEVILSEHLKQSHFVQEIFALLDKKYLEHDGNQFIEIHIDTLDESLQDTLVTAGFEATNIVRNAQRNRNFEYFDAMLFTKQNLANRHQI
jgi:hypothetical protein